MSEVVKYGRCEYCGQMVAVKIPEEKEDAFDDDALSFLATQNCDCKEGDQARKQQIEMDSAKNTIDLYTKNVHEEFVRDIMCEAVEKIEEETMTKNDLRDLHDDIINDLEEINYLTEGYKE